VLNNKLILNKLLKTEEDIEKTTNSISSIQIEIDNLVDSLGAGINKNLIERINTKTDLLLNTLHKEEHKLSSLIKTKSNIKSFNADDIQCKIADLKTKIHGEKGKSSRLKLRQIILDFVDRIDVYRYGIPLEGVQLIGVVECMQNANIPKEKIDSIIEQHNKNLKLSKNISYKITFKSGMERIINVDSVTGISSAIDNETWQVSHLGNVIGYKNNFSDSENIALTIQEVDDAWKRKW